MYLLFNKIDSIQEYNVLLFFSETAVPRKLYLISKYILSDYQFYKKKDIFEDYLSDINLSIVFYSVNRIRINIEKLKDL